MPDGKMINVPSLTLEENQAIVDEAHRRGLKVACPRVLRRRFAYLPGAGVDLPIHVIVALPARRGLTTKRSALQKAAGGWNSPPRESDYLGFGRPSRTIGPESQRRKEHTLAPDGAEFQKAVAAGVKQIVCRACAGTFPISHRGELIGLHAVFNSVRAAAEDLLHAGGDQLLKLSSVRRKRVFFPPLGSQVRLFERPAKSQIV